MKLSCLLRGLSTVTQPKAAGRILVTPRYHLSLWCSRFLVPLGYRPKLVFTGELPERSHRFQKARERWPAQKVTAVDSAV